MPDLVRDGHEVAVSTWYGLEGAPHRMTIRPRHEPKGEPVGVVTVLPAVDTGAYGAGSMYAAWQKIGPDVCITCMDLWVLPPELIARMKVAAWLPIDHDPCPAGIAASARATMMNMSYSKWGQRVLQEAGIACDYVPCSADASVYTPMDRDKAKGLMGLPPDTDFLVSMVAANKDASDRKGFGEALQGFARFAASHPQARMYVHTNWAGPVNILALATRLGIADRLVRPTDWEYSWGMFDERYMQTVYSASDVLLNPSKSEGFGLPLLEAQMCGCPIAASDFSTTDELLFAGWKIPGQLDWSYGAEAFRLRVYVDAVADVLAQAYEERGNELLRRQARKGAISLDTEKVFKEHWKPALAKMEKLAAGGGEAA